MRKRLHMYIFYDKHSNLPVSLFSNSLIRGVRQFGAGNWSQILKDPVFGYHVSSSLQYTVEEIDFTFDVSSS